jgi:hypothetical protein
MSAIPQPIVHLVVAQHHLPQREAEGEKTHAYSRYSPVLKQTLIKLGNVRNDEYLRLVNKVVTTNNQQ